MATAFVLAVVITAVTIAIMKIVKDRARGVKCTGCPYGGSCNKSGCSSNSEADAKSVKYKTVENKSFILKN